MAFFGDKPAKSGSYGPFLPREGLLHRLDWLANLAYHKGFYSDAKIRVVTDFFAPAYAAAGFPTVDSMEMHNFFFAYLSELASAAESGSGLSAAGAHLVSLESPACSYSAESADLRQVLYRMAAEYIDPRYDSIEWPDHFCAAHQVFMPLDEKLR